MTYSVETFQKSNDFADVPLVCNDDSAILAQKVTLSFLAVQDSSIGDLVTHSLTESLIESGFDFSDFRDLTLQ